MERPADTKSAAATVQTRGCTTVTTPRKITDLKRKTVATTGSEAYIGRAVAVQIAGREVILVADSMVACNEVMRAIGIQVPNARLSNAVAVIQQKNCVVVEKS
jgi:hypothetical protein